MVRVDTHRSFAHIGLCPVEPEAGELLQRGCRQRMALSRSLFWGSRAATV